MNSKRFHQLMLVLIGLMLAGLVGGAYAVNGMLANEANKLTALKAKSVALDQQAASLTKAKKSLGTYADLQKVTQQVVPEDKNQAAAVREIVNIAAANEISLGSITFPASTLGVDKAAASGVVAKPVPANSKQAALSQLQAVKDIPGVYQLIITVQSDPLRPVAYSKFVNFLADLEHNRRTAQVSTISISPTALNHNLITFTLTINEYIKP